MKPASGEGGIPVTSRQSVLSQGGSLTLTAEYPYLRRAITVPGHKTPGVKPCLRTDVLDNKVHGP